MSILVIYQPVLCVLVSRLPSSSALSNLRHAAFAAVRIFLFLSPDLRRYIVDSMCIYTQIGLCTDCTWITVVTKIPLQWNVFTQIGALRSVDWIFIVGAPVWRWLGEYVTLDRTFYVLLSKQEVVAATVTATFYGTPRINLMITLCINYIIIIFINHNNAVINNNLWKTPIPYFCPQKFSLAHEIISSKCLVNLGNYTQKDSPALA
jgi:hypothetical protein